MNTMDSGHAMESQFCQQCLQNKYMLSTEDTTFDMALLPPSPPKK